MRKEDIYKKAFFFRMGKGASFFHIKRVGKIYAECTEISKLSVNERERKFRWVY